MLPRGNGGGRGRGKRDDSVYVQTVASFEQRKRERVIDVLT